MDPARDGSDPGLSGRGPYAPRLMVHRFDVAVRWADLDPYRHVNHATYLAYCESARIALLEEIGFSMRRLAELGCQIVIVGLEARWLAPALEGMTVTVETEVEEVGRVRSSWRQRILHDDEVLFDAMVSAAFTDESGRPRRAPEGFVEAAGAA